MAMPKTISMYTEKVVEVTCKCPKCQAEHIKKMKLLDVPKGIVPRLYCESHDFIRDQSHAEGRIYVDL